ncbi:MAG: fibronectin type III domain-containing protein [Chitinophagales bacterium]
MDKRNLYLFILITYTFLPLAIFGQPATWQSRGIGGGGALFSPSVNPGNISEMYIACDMTEVFHTSNSGVNWETVHFNELTSVTSSSVQFTSDNNIRYAVSSDFFTDSRFPVKSTNAGNTWTTISDPTGSDCYSIFADDNSTQRIIISSYNKIYFSNNGGTSFTNIYTNMGSGAAYVGGVFFDGSNIYIGAAKNLIVSADNGATFNSYVLTGLAAGRGIMSFTGAHEGATTRLFISSFDLVDIYPGVTGADFSAYKSIYKMDYSVGGSWVAAATGISLSNKPFFIDMAENDIDIAYCAGGNTSTGYPIVFKTTNGGGSWSAVLLTNNNENIYTGYQGDGGDEGWYFDEFAEGFTVSSTNNNVAAITGLGFPHFTTDGGAIWKQQYVNPADQNPINLDIVKGKNYAGAGLENTSCWTLCWSDANNIFGGYSDITAIKSSDAGSKWNKNYFTLTENSVYKVIKENATGKLYAATSSAHDIYQSTYLSDANIDGGTGRILYSSDLGTNWNVLHDFADPVIWLTLDPNVANKMYGCVINSVSGGIYVSSNIDLGAASTWVKLSNPPRTEGHPYNIHVLNDGTLIAVYSGRRNAAGVFTASSGVFKSTDGGTTWTDISDPGMFYWTKDLIIDNSDAAQNTFYCAVFSGWGGPPNGLGGIYKTNNRGTSWTKINSLDRVESITIDPNNPNDMYATTESDGLWITHNLTSGAPTFSQVANYPFMHPVRVFFNPNNLNEIWITSFGNGLKMGTLNNCAKPTGLSATGVTSTTATITWSAIPGATSYKITRKVTGGSTYNYNAATNSITMTDLTPGTTNKITVKSKCGAIFSDKSTTLTVVTPLRSGETQQELLIYPNPANSEINLALSSADYNSIDLMRIDGIIIHHIAITSKFINIPLAEIPNGIYLLVIKGDETIKTEKIIVAH